MVYEILRMIDDEKVSSSITMWNYLNEEVRTQLDACKQMSNLYKKYTSSDNSIITSDALQKKL